MITKNGPELIEVSLPFSFQKNKNTIQDKQIKNLNEENQSSYITKKQKDFIIATNKSFFHEFGNVYTQNILLKSKLNELLNEKKELNQIIIKKENQRKKIKKLKKSNSEYKEEKKDIDDNNSDENAVTYYRKKKRIRRKKNEIKYVYNCSFHNCNKSYPTKGSLNMHIKLKHKNDLGFNFNAEEKI